MDTNFLQKGQPCSKLKPSYVIFICLHDPFKKGEAVYRFEQIDSNLQLELNDEAYTMVLFHEIERQRRLNGKTDLVLLFPGFSRLGTSRTMFLALRLTSQRRRQSRCKTGVRAKATAESKDESRAAQRPDQWFCSMKASDSEA